MFQDVDGDDAIKMSVRKIQTLLNIADAHLHFRKALANAFRHVLAQLKCDVFGLLLRSQLFPRNMLAETRTDFQGAFEVPRRMSHHVAMVPAIDKPQLIRKEFMP